MKVREAQGFHLTGLSVKIGLGFIVLNRRNNSLLLPSITVLMTSCFNHTHPVLRFPRFMVDPLSLSR